MTQGDDEAARPLLEESLALRREIKDPQGDRLDARQSFPGARPAAATLEGATAALRECLSLAGSFGTHQLAVRTLTAVADATARFGDAECATRLHAAAQNVRSAIDSPSQEMDRKQQLESIESLRGSLDSTAFRENLGARTVPVTGRRIRACGADAGSYLSGDGSPFLIRANRLPTRARGGFPSPRWLGTMDVERREVSSELNPRRGA